MNGPLPITQLGKEDTHIILLSAGGRSRDSTAKRNLSKGHVEDLDMYDLRFPELLKA